MRSVDDVVAIEGPALFVIHRHWKNYPAPSQSPPQQPLKWSCEIINNNATTVRIEFVKFLERQRNASTDIGLNE